MLRSAICAIPGDEELPVHMSSTVVMPRGEEVEVLGVKLSSELKGYHGLYHRLEKGRKAHFADVRFYRSRAVSLKEKFR
eukprot:7399976-Pyramimonas_sp.AAC.1